MVVEEALGRTPTGSVGFGSTVVVSDQRRRRADLADRQLPRRHAREGRLSAESPLAVALLGRAPGEQTAVSLPRGTRTLTILSVS